VQYQSELVSIFCALISVPLSCFFFVAVSELAILCASVELRLLCIPQSLTYIRRWYFSNCGHRMQETTESLRRSRPFCSWPLPRQSWDQIRSVPFHRGGTLPTELWGGLLLSFSAVTRALQRPENEECYLPWEELSLILACVCLGQRLHSHGSGRNLTSLSFPLTRRSWAVMRQLIKAGLGFSASSCHLLARLGWALSGLL